MIRYYFFSINIYFSRSSSLNNSFFFLTHSSFLVMLASMACRKQINFTRKSLGSLDVGSDKPTVTRIFEKTCRSSVGNRISLRNESNNPLNLPNIEFLVNEYSLFIIVPLFYTTIFLFFFFH